MSSGKATALLTRVQLNPEILTDDAAFMADAIQQAAEYLVNRAGLPRYPELSQGYALGDEEGSTDISGASSNEFKVSVNGSGFVSVSITLGSLTTGTAIKTELQAQIRAASDDHGFDEVTVSESSGQYTITSGRYGRGSSIQLGFEESKKHVLQELKLHPKFGATEVVGAWAHDDFDDAVVYMTAALYRTVGVEGAKSVTVPGDVTASLWDSDPIVRGYLNNTRRVPLPGVVA